MHARTYRRSNFKGVVTFGNTRNDEKCERPNSHVVIKIEKTHRQSFVSSILKLCVSPSHLLSKQTCVISHEYKPRSQHKCLSWLYVSPTHLQSKQIVVKYHRYKHRSPQYFDSFTSARTTYNQNKASSIIFTSRLRHGLEVG